MIKYRTAESVTPGHPDKICDRISDAILDACLEQDPDSRVAIETMGGHGIITITGELTTEAYVNIHKIVKGIVGNKYGIQVNIVQQSPEIAGGVDTGGAGDQGIMVGYATSETENLIPLEVELSRSLARHLYKKFPYDGKTQITLVDDKIKTIVVSFQNTKREILEREVKKWLNDNDYGKTEKINLFLNPAGDWELGGFEVDTGVTGRKLAIDNYGPQIPIGGGCFSGKDATKVDRSGAYMARKIAVDYLKKRKTEEVFVKLAYSIGMAEPVQAVVEIDGVQEKIEGYDLTPAGIIDFLKLKKPQFQKTAEWGHFGNDFIWD